MFSSSATAAYWWLIVIRWFFVARHFSVRPFYVLISLKTLSFNIVFPLFLHVLFLPHHRWMIIKKFSPQQRARDHPFSPLMKLVYYVKKWTNRDLSTALPWGYKTTQSEFISIWSGEIYFDCNVIIVSLSVSFLSPHRNISHHITKLSFCTHEWEKFYRSKYNGI